MRIEVVAVPGCPNAPVVEQRLAEALAGRPDVEVTVVRRVAGTQAQAERYGMRGSPTVLINGRDPFAAPGTGTGTGVSCRLYWDETGQARGAPSTGQLRAALAAACDNRAAERGDRG
jgi:predicted DsbA family dithiol-disulfide isomerase